MAKGKNLGEALTRCARRSRRLLHLRRRHQERLRRAARSDRLQAGGHGRDRPVRRLRLGISRARQPARHRAAPRVWEPEPATVYFWEHATGGMNPSRTQPCQGLRDADLRSRRSRRLRELNQALHASRAGDERDGRSGGHPSAGQPCRRGRRRRSRSRSMCAGSVGYYCAGMNDGGDDHRARLGRSRRRREHDVGQRRRQGRRQPVCRRHRPRRPAGHRGQRRRRAAASR